MSGKSVQHQHDSEHTENASPASAAPGTNARQPRGNAAAQEAMNAHTGCGHAHATGGDQTATPMTTKADALRENQKGVHAFEQLVARGLRTPVDPEKGHQSLNNLFHNAAEWVDEGEADVVILTPTHDSASRVTDPADAAYFDPTSTWRSGAANYDENNLGNQDQIEIMAANVLGTMSNDGKILTMVDPANKSDQVNIETLIHEVQHDADQHSTVWGDFPNSGRAPTWAYNNYMTEFRAYWFENPEGSSTDRFPASSGTNVTNFDITVAKRSGRTVTVTTAFQNERQQAIFTHLISPNRTAGDWFDYANRDWSQTYAYVGYYYAKDAAFKAYVDSHASPTAGNAIGSVRIQLLSEVLGSACGDVEMTSLEMVVGELDELDHVFLADRALSAPFWAQARASLTDTQFETFETMMNSGN